MSVDGLETLLMGLNISFGPVCLGLCLNSKAGPTVSYGHGLGSNWSCTLE